jgi:sRNA-binding regulator protein Hfq
MTKRIVRETAATAVRKPAAASSTALLEPAKLPTPIIQAAIVNGAKPAQPARKLRVIPTGIATTNRFSAASHEDHGSNRQAELFYLQKQIQLQTQMVFILEDGARVQGVIEWYDRNSIKVRGRSRVLLFKSAIKYLYKAGEVGSAPE